MDIRPLTQPPPNWAAFVDEIAAGLRSLYGPGPALHYRRTVGHQFATLLSQPAIRAWAAWQGDEAVAMVLAMERDRVGYVLSIHALDAHETPGAANAVVRAAGAALGRACPYAVVSDCVPFCGVDMAEPLVPLGFERVARGIMCRPLADWPAAGGMDSMPIDPGRQPEVAALFLETYAAHPGRRFHVEVGDRARACDLVAGAVAGAFGRPLPECCRLVLREGRVVGAALVAETLSGLGFILHVAVAPPYQRQGLGRRLLRETLACLKRRGLETAALAVTLDNPARHLYESLGFRLAKPYDAFVWRGAGP